MTEQEMQALIKEGEGIDQGAVEHAEAAATGNLDDKGNIIAPVDNTVERAMEWMIIPQTLAWAITAALPETAPAYTPEKCLELAKAFVPVADKYGWNGPGQSPELSLLMCGAMFTMPAFLAYKVRKDAAKEAAKLDNGKDMTPQAPAAGEPILKPINGSTP
jgi:hypothetical protein